MHLAYTSRSGALRYRFLERSGKEVEDGDAEGVPPEVGGDDACHYKIDREREKRMKLENQKERERERREDLGEGRWRRCLAKKSA